MTRQFTYNELLALAERAIANNSFSLLRYLNWRTMNGFRGEPNCKFWDDGFLVYEDTRNADGTLRRRNCERDFLCIWDIDLDNNDDVTRLC